MSELNELYQETILEHNKNPRNFRAIDNADKSALGNNPLCGDALQFNEITDLSNAFRTIRFAVMRFRFTSKWKATRWRMLHSRVRDVRFQRHQPR